MTYKGQVKNGVVVLERPDLLPEGAVVRVRVLQEPEQTLGDRLLRHAGRAKDLPNDLAANHDHYLHGVPKR